MPQTELAVQPVSPAPPGAEGPAPAPRRPPGLSPSRANDYLQCPLLFRFRVVDRLPEPPSAAAVRGTLVHAVLERLYDAPAGARTPAAARALVAPEWDRMLQERPECAEVLADDVDLDAWFAQAGALLDTYFTLEDPNRLQPAERELDVATQLEDGPQLRGIVDRVDVAPDGAIRIVDYKTGRSPREGFESGALFQMRFYALVVSRLRHRVPAMLQLVYLGDGTVLRHVPDEAELRTTERRVRAIWSGIVAAAEQGSWTPRPGPLCGWCAHKDLCPAFGGTPPEVPPGAVELTLGVTPRS
ncbi:RecB family exonuclease [Cellulomonas carbonis]|uniref:Exodeoxyribonuclease V subunit beta n=1 Tax=Cellulomonas carbonis T26 TaxID=947969 RepID=A0A0A0BV01_9CELL|nr:exodeoxyribonuclease V subunit beta [Cellulomonas carbonis T26]GGB95891.1 recombinase RecB [Cellulomonas carbonis]